MIRNELFAVHLKRILVIVFVVALFAIGVTCFLHLPGCATIEEIDQIEASLVKLEAEVRVGGGGDSVTAWIYALIAGASVLYPLVLRPIRKQWEAK